MSWFVPVASDHQGLHTILGLCSESGASDNVCPWPSQVLRPAETSPEDKIKAKHHVTTLFSPKAQWALLCSPFPAPWGPGTPSFSMN